MLRHLARTLALRAVGICRVQRVDTRNGLELKLRHVRVYDGEVLLAEHHTVGKAQPIDLALGGAHPRAMVADCDRQGFERFRPLCAQVVKAAVLGFQVL